MCRLHAHVLTLPLVFQLTSCEIFCESFGLTAHRPDPARWHRTRCGGPEGKSDIPTQWSDHISASSTPLPHFPRPQMVRGEGKNLSDLRDKGDPSLWCNLNGLWEWEPASSEVPHFNRQLKEFILVPFPVESCLSGTGQPMSTNKSMWYRLAFDYRPRSGRTLLHFGAVDWQCAVYLNGKLLGKHMGGYTPFAFDVTDSARSHMNELLVWVNDPSEFGPGPNGKQKSLKALEPGIMDYTPSSGIWQTVWLEAVPKQYISSIKIDQSSLTGVTVNTDVISDGEMLVEITGDADVVQTTSVSISVKDGEKEVSSAIGTAGKPVHLEIPCPRLWSPGSANLYDLQIAVGGDVVHSYFGLRTVTLQNSSIGVRPLINGRYIFMLGILDQSFWPDGLYTPPVEEALTYDILSVKKLGFNTIRVHQKVNPERYYYLADRHGLVVFQDMVQKRLHASKDTVPSFIGDMNATMLGLWNHPSILQWVIFNEEDCWRSFDQGNGLGLEHMLKLARELDPTRLIDLASGGGAHNFWLGDVKDTHTYPAPNTNTPTYTQYAMLGEFGGTSLGIRGHMWEPGQCGGFTEVGTCSKLFDEYIRFAKTIKKRVGCMSSTVYTQLTDIELECNGLFTYDRVLKFDEWQQQAILDANVAIIRASENPALRSLRETWGFLHMGAVPKVLQWDYDLRHSLCRLPD